MFGYEEVNANAANANANAPEMPQILGFNDIHENSIYKITNKQGTFKATIINKHIVDEEFRLVFRRDTLIEYSVPFNWVSVDLDN
jgi:hypothetical protein